MSKSKAATEKGYKARVAWVLRHKVKMGGVLTDDERRWLNEYRRAVKAHRAGEVSSPPSVSIDESAEVQADPTSAETPPPLAAPLPQVDPEDDRRIPEPDFSEAASSDDPASEKPDSSADDDARRQGGAMADKYCNWLRAMNARISDMGGVAIPDELIDTALHYAAEQSFTRVARAVGERMSERAQDVSVVAAGAVSYLQLHYLQKKAERGPIPSASQKPASQKPPEVVPQLNGSRPRFRVEG